MKDFILPAAEDILAVLRASPAALTVGQLLKQLGLPARSKLPLRLFLHAMASEGRFREAALLGKVRGEPNLPLVAEVCVTGRDRHGAPVGRLAQDDPLGAYLVRTGQQPVVFLHAEPAGEPEIQAGFSVLARLRAVGAGLYEGRILNRMGKPRMSGFLHPENGEIRASDPVMDRVLSRAVPEEVLESVMESGAKSGDLALMVGTDVRLFGASHDPVALCAVTRAAYDLPDGFPPEVLAEAEKLEPPTLTGRRDLRDVPFVTMDGPDARDFDDAIAAFRTETGFRLMVAIADVSAYVRPGSALDREARRRGNSVYFPDMVVPMLPPRLSEDLCSLRPGEDRACVLFEIEIDRDGNQTDFRISRGLIRSHARLTYEEAQAIRLRDDAEPASGAARLKRWIALLFEAHHCLAGARLRRAALAVADEKNVRIALDRESGWLDVSCSMPLESAKLVESFMIAAGQACAPVLRQKGGGAMFRRHAAREGIRLPATYSAEPAAHDGLVLDLYAHVTSPIRRYADLLNHRVLFTTEGSDPAPGALAVHLMLMDAKAQESSQVARNRLVCLWLLRQRDRVLEGYVTGATRFGSLVALTEYATIGLLPFSQQQERWACPDSVVEGKACSVAETSSATGIPSLPLKKGSSVTVRVVGRFPDSWLCVLRCVPSTV